MAFKLDFFITVLLLGSGANELRFQTKCSVTSKNNSKVKLCCYSSGRINGYTQLRTNWQISTFSNALTLSPMTTKCYWMVIHYVVKDASKFGGVDFYNIAVTAKSVANPSHFWPFKG